MEFDKFSNWLSENIDPKYQEKMLAHGYHYVDGIETPYYKMYLFENIFLPKKYKYQIVFQRFDTDAFDYESQADLDKNTRQKINLNDQYSTIQIMFDKLLKWLDIYKSICVASSQDTKTTKWLNSIKYLSEGKLIIKEETFMGHRIVVISK